GVNPLAAGLAGVLSTRLDVFFLYAGAGAFLWAGAWITLGYLCADTIGLVVAGLAPFGKPLGIAIAAALILYVGYKVEGRRRFLRHLRKARIEPSELKRRIDAGDDLVIVDVR